MKSISKILVACIALGATALTAFSQTPSRATPTPITLPVTYLAPGESTNFPGGWNPIQLVTSNAVVLYTNNVGGTGNPGFYTNVWYSTNAPTSTFSVFYAGQQNNIGLQLIACRNGGGSYSNLTLFFARGDVANLPDTQKNFVWVSPGTLTNANGVASDVTNFQNKFMESFQYLYLVGMSNGDTSVGISNIQLWANYQSGAK